MRFGSPSVIDTNVLLVANEQHSGASAECVIACVEALTGLTRTGVVVLDDGYEIIGEYGRKTAPNTGNRVGDAFLKWLYQNARNPDRVENVHVDLHERRGYEQFPDDAELSDFDLEDRKFVAASVAHPGIPPILQATDSKWANWAQRLARYGIKVEFLCRADVERFIKRKLAERV